MISFISILLIAQPLIIRHFCPDKLILPAIQAFFALMTDINRKIGQSIYLTERVMILLTRNNSVNKSVSKKHLHRLCFLLPRLLLPVSVPSIAAFGRKCPTGERLGCRSFAEGQGWPFCKPRTKARSTGNRRKSGGLFFGYFLLAAQKKVSRLPVREPALKQLRQPHFLAGVEMTIPIYFSGIYPF
jgi:hypothetical protein